MRVSEVEDPPHLSGFYWHLFGYDSKLSKEEFLDRVVNSECNWIFDAKQLRIKMNGFL